MESKQELDIYEQLNGAGFHLAQEIYRKENKINNLGQVVNKFGWKLFNYIHSSRKLEFVFYLERLYASLERQPSKTLMSILRESNPNRFKELALAFMMGFISNNKNEKEKGGSDEQ